MQKGHSQLVICGGTATTNYVGLQLFCHPVNRKQLEGAQSN